MAAGEWVSVSAQNELIERELEVERRELLPTRRPRRRSWRRCTSPTAWSREHAQRAAADVMREPDEALAVHARAELGVDPAQLAVAVAGRGVVVACASCSAPCCRWSRGCWSATGTAPTVGLRASSASSPRPSSGR